MDLLTLAQLMSTSVLDLAHKLQLTPIFHEARLGEVQRSCLAVDAAGRTLNWSAEVALEDGLALTLQSI